MSKHIKNEIISLKNSILKYKIKIPSPNQIKFDKDIKMIFHEMDNTVDYDSLNDIKNMARIKLISLRRLYGDLEVEKEKLNKQVDEDMIRLSKLKINKNMKTEEYVINDEKEKNANLNLEEFIDDKTYFDEVNKLVKELESKNLEIQNYPTDRNISFNKEKVEEYRKEVDKINLQLYHLAREKQEKLNIEKAKTKGKKEMTGDMAKQMISEILKQNKMDKEDLEGFDFESFAKNANMNNAEHMNPFKDLVNPPPEGINKESKEEETMSKDDFTEQDRENLFSAQENEKKGRLFFYKRKFRY